MKFMRNKGYNLLDHRRNEDVLGIKVDPVENKSAHCNQKMLITR